MTRVSIGVPVLNGAATINESIGALRRQTHHDLEIVVCDNASTDNTAARVAALAAEDERIRLVRHSDRVDIMCSFRRTFQASSAPFFMFVGADDRLDETFVAKAAAILDADPTLAGCCGKVAFVSGGRVDYVSPATYPLDGNRRANLLGYLADPHDNARLFGLFRRAALEGAFPARWYPAWDYQFGARLLAHGGQAELPEILLWRDKTPKESYLAEIEGAYRSRLLRSFPHLQAAWAIWRDPTTPAHPSVAWNLLLLAIRSHLSFAGVRNPRWGAVARSLARRLRFQRWALCRPRAEVPSAHSPPSGARRRPPGLGMPRA